MARIDYAVSMSAIQSVLHEGQTFEAIEEDIGKSLSGGKSDSTWGGAVSYVHKQSRTSTNTVSVGSTVKGLWVKHTGKKYDSGLSTTDEPTTVVTVTGAADVICKLASGQAIFLPVPKQQTVTFTDDAGGEAVAVEVAVLT